MFANGWREVVLVHCVSEKKCGMCVAEQFVESWGVHQLTQIPI